MLNGPKWCLALDTGKCYLKGTTRVRYSNFYGAIKICKKDMLYALIRCN